MTFSEWCQKWGVPHQAEMEYRGMMGVVPAPLVNFMTGTGKNEADVQSRVRLALAQRGYNVWRNNVGAMKDDRGNYFRFGLANDSAKMNSYIKSADLVGLRSLIVQPEDVGKIVGQFVSYEVKREGWRFTGTDEEVAQMKWAEIINSMGGHAKFTTGVDDL
jgi:hypothetical protein